MLQEDFRFAKKLPELSVSLTNEHKPFENDHLPMTQSPSSVSTSGSNLGYDLYTQSDMTVHVIWCQRFTTVSIFLRMTY